MTNITSRLARRVDKWRRDRAAYRATLHLDDHLRRDVGLPGHDADRHSGRTFLFPYLNR